MKFFLPLLLLSVAAHCADEPAFADVFQSGTQGFPSIRIPSVVVTNSGIVLAFAEGRNKASDQAQNKIVLERSTDGGETWGPLQVIADDGANSLNNPTALLNGTGRVLLVYQRIPADLTEHSKNIETGFDGPNVYRTFLITSDDDGVTWSKPQDITRGTKHETVATTVASGPGIGIRLVHSAHKGRLIIPFNEGPYNHWNVYAAFSDDDGKTWHCGENAPGASIPDAKLGQRSQVNEVQMVELSDGSILLNSRQFAGAKVRKTAVSKDGGVTWSEIRDEPALRDPGCMASIFRYMPSGNGEPAVLLYSGPDSDKRANGTIHLSSDRGATWPIARVLHPGGFAYSVLTRLPDGKIGCLFEADNYKRIVFARFTLDWLKAR